MEMQACSRRTLAAGDVAVIERCSCGAVHVTIGAITLRLAACAIAPLAATLHDAACRLVFERALATSDVGDEVVS